jgi:hypothetical protein
MRRVGLDAAVAAEAVWPLPCCFPSCTPFCDHMSPHPAPRPVWVHHSAECRAVLVIVTDGAHLFHPQRLPWIAVLDKRQGRLCTLDRMARPRRERNRLAAPHSCQWKTPGRNIQAIGAPIRCQYRCGRRASSKPLPISATQLDRSLYSPCSHPDVATKIWHLVQRLVSQRAIFSVPVACYNVRRPWST